MLLWENESITVDKDFMPEYKICFWIEKVGWMLQPRYEKTRMKPDKDGKYWFKDFKLWEYPILLRYLHEFGKQFDISYPHDKKIKIMDFGCWASPLPQFISEYCRTDVEVHGVDNDGWGDIKNIGYDFLEMVYPNVKYHFKDLSEVEENNFDFIYSSSVIEHIQGDNNRIKILKQLRDKLSPTGKMFHTVDYYFPEKSNRDNERANWWEICSNLGFDVLDGNVCPGHDDCTHEKIKEHVNFSREWNQESRLAIGDNL